MREVPVKNYVILAFTALGVVLVCFLLSNIYKKNGEKKYVSIIKEVASSEIQYDDLENYIQENPDFVLYIFDSEEKNSKDVEKTFKKLIVDNDISHYIVYIEKTKEIKDKYDLDSNSPIFLAYQNGVLKEVLSKDEYTSKDIESFLTRNKVIEND